MARVDCGGHVADPAAPTLTLAPAVAGRGAVAVRAGMAAAFD